MPEPEPFNADALLDEISASRRPFTMRGETFYLLPPTAMPDEVLAMAAADDVIGISRALLGAAYDRFVSVGGSALLLQQIYERVFGAPMGESSASSGSSAPTGKPSKRTSSTTTGSTS